MFIAMNILLTFWFSFWSDFLLQTFINISCLKNGNF